MFPSSAQSLTNAVQMLADPSTWMGLVNALIPFAVWIVIIIITYFVSSLIYKTVKKLLHHAKLDAHLSSLTKQHGKFSLSEPIANLAYYMIWLIALPMILEQFSLNAVIGPINQMINSILSFVPHLFWAIVTFVILFIVAKILKSLVTQVLEWVDLNGWLEKVGLWEVTKKLNIPLIAGVVVFWMMILIALNQSLWTLNLPVLTAIVTRVLIIAGNVLLGSAIIILGVVIANVVESLISEHSGHQKISKFAKVIIILLVGLSGIEQMGLQTDIISDASRLFLASIALGFAIAMGLWAKDSVGELVWKALHKFK